MSSTRLPGKVLLPLAGAPMILRQIERVARARRIDRVVVATSVDASDDALAEVLAGAGVAVHRGPLDDVLARFVGALDTHGPAEHVVPGHGAILDAEGALAVISEDLAYLEALRDRQPGAGVELPGKRRGPAQRARHAQNVEHLRSDGSAAAR